MIKRTLYLVLILLVFGTSFYTLNAQVQNSDISLVMIPTHPKPGDSVSVSIKSFSTDLSKSYIAWFLDNESVASGIGKTTYEFTLGKVGTKTNITVNVDLANGLSLSKNMVLNSADTDMLWEAVDSYTPPFYRGKTLVGTEGSFKVVAIPSVVSLGQKVHPNNLSYVWKLNGGGQPEASGWGKNSLSFKSTFLDKISEVTVKVSDISNTVVGEGRINLKTVEPKVVFYKKNISGGFSLDKSLSKSINISTDGEVLVAVPYFFSLNNFEVSNINFQWFVNNREISTPYPKNELYVKGESGTTGRASVKVIVTNEETLLQTAENTINISF